MAQRNESNNARAQTSDQRMLRSCPFCERTFRKNEHVLRHIRSHTKERPYRCRYCRKTYPRKDTLQRHERGHKGSQVDGDSALANPVQSESSNGDQAIATADVELSSLNFTHSPQSTPLGTEQTTSQLHLESATHQDVPLREPQATTLRQTADRVSGVEAVTNTAAADQSEQHQPHDRLVDTAINYLDLDTGGFDDPYLAQYSWLLSSNFDIGAVDSALNETLFEWAQVPPPANTAPSMPQPTMMQQPEGNLQSQCRSNNLSDATEKSTTTDRLAASFGAHIPLVHRWFTHFQPEEVSARAGNLISRAASENPGQELNIDEQYTATLSRYLQPRQYEETPLSIDYLNTCLKLYYLRFNPVFPVIHFPTFRSNSRNALLCLSMCSVGSLFIGSPAARNKGYKIYSRLNKVVLASWETFLSGTPERSLSVVQAALIGQTFGLLSGESNNLVMTDVFQGTMISWARRLGYFDNFSLDWPPENLGLTSIKQAWKDWAFAEQTRRLVLALYIHDAELANLFHHEPLLRHLSFRSSPLSNDALFDAPTAEKWYSLLNSARHHYNQVSSTNVRDWSRLVEPENQNSITVSMRTSQLSSYTILENINASIIEARNLGEFDAQRQQNLTEGLILWCRTCLQARQDLDNDDLALKILWHSCFMNLSTDFSSLERSLGRDGHSRSSNCFGDLIGWASSTAALRCLLHALALKELAESMRLDWNPPIHVPRVLFNAGIAWICHWLWVKFRDHSHRPPEGAHLNEPITQFAEFDLELWPFQHLMTASDILGERSTSHHQCIIYGIVELLQRLDRWSISTNFAEILREASSDSV